MEPDYVVNKYEQDDEAPTDLRLKSKVMATQDNEEIVIQEFEQIRRGGPMIRVQNQRQITRSTMELTERLRHDNIADNDSFQTSEFKINESKENTMSDNDECSPNKQAEPEPIKHGRLSSIINIKHSDQNKKFNKSKELKFKQLKDFADNKIDIQNIRK